MQKTKILFLIHTLQVGGAEKALVNLVNNLNPNKFDITVMTVINTGAFKESLNTHIHYKTIIKLPHKSNKKPQSHQKKSGNLLQGTSRVKKVLASIYQFVCRRTNFGHLYKRFITDKYDVEIAFLEGIAAKIIANSDNPNSKKIAWIHVDLLEERKSEKFFSTREEEKRTYQNFDQIIAVSNTVKSQFEKKFKYDPRKVTVCYNPIDKKEITKLSVCTKISKSCFTICSIGRLSTQKGFDRLLRIAQKLNQDKLQFELWIIGEGAEEGNLKKYITEHNLNNVKLLGYKANPYPYIKSADLYVCSSHAEGFSTTTSEAIILGTPVISTNCSGAQEILGDSKYGVICQNNETSLYSSIKKLITNTKVYQHYANKASERSNYFDLKQSVIQITKILESPK